MDIVRVVNGKITVLDDIDVVVGLRRGMSVPERLTTNGVGDDNG